MMRYNVIYKCKQEISNMKGNHTMELIKDIKNISKHYIGHNGEAVIIKNMGNKDRIDKWSVSVVVNGKYKKLANRVDFEKAYTMAENLIG